MASAPLVGSGGGAVLGDCLSLEEPERVGKAALLSEGARLGHAEPDEGEGAARLRFQPTRNAAAAGG